jgi:hypothetical protein
MKVRGIKRGQAIELLEKLDQIPDGMEVTVEIKNRHPLDDLSDEEIQKRIAKVAGVWKDNLELEEIFTEIDRDRHIDFGREIVSFDD